MTQTIELDYTSLDDIDRLVEVAQAAARERTTQPVAWRRSTLERLRDLISAREEAVIDALASDLAKPRAEARATETIFTLADIEHTLAHLDSWMRPERVPTPLVSQPASSKIVAEPLGTVCVIAPWNYPFQLVMAPLIAAISAGNAVVVKPSELAPATAVIVGEIIAGLNEPGIGVVQGGVAETGRLLEHRFDHILYTGNSRVARIVMQAAAAHLTPVTLELGGKSPAIVTENANIAVAARRVAWAKFLNAGQTCIAPDYVLVAPAVHDEFVEALRSTLVEFYGEDPQASPDFARIISTPQFHRIEKLLDSGTVAIGGQSDADSRFVAPTVLVDVDASEPVMAEEIFGPVLPVLRSNSVAEATEFVRSREKPLALYVFSEDSDEVDEVISSTSSGGVCVNAAVMHVSNPYLPFGGVGESGMGAYHGRAGFDTFSHRRSVMNRSTRVDPPLLYPPYRQQNEKLIEKGFLLPDPRDLVAKVRSKLPF